MRPNWKRIIDKRDKTSGIGDSGHYKPQLRNWPVNRLSRWLQKTFTPKPEKGSSQEGMPTPEDKAAFREEEAALGMGTKGMKKGGKVRGAGIARKGVRPAKMR